MHLIVGLGNPGRDYVDTRHNCGFMAVDRLAERWRAAWKTDSRLQARLSRIEVPGRPVLLCEPVTFMNLSGAAVQAVAAYYKTPLEALLVVVDDADLPLGALRMRPGGSNGGHHGLESVEQHLGTRQYARLRIGIGRRSAEDRQITGHVLGRFARSERALLKATLERACDQMECWVAFGTLRAMNAFNGTVNTPGEGKLIQ